MGKELYTKKSFNKKLQLYIIKVEAEIYLSSAITFITGRKLSFI